MDSSLSDLQRRLLSTDLARLGFRTDDATEFRHLVKSLGSGNDMMARVGAVSHTMRALVGDLEADDRGVLDVDDASSPEDGLIALMALVAVADDVHREHLHRGIPEDVSWKSLSDLGQQVHIHRLVHGSFGMSSQSWCAANYTGRHLWLGRLQYTVEQDRDNVTDGADSHVLGVHIPESGPLFPTAINESLRMAQQIAFPAYQDYGPRTITLRSWLLDPGINARLSPQSNLRQFTQRFELYGNPTDAYRDALFFGFHIEPPDVDVDALPQDTSLQRAIVAQLKGAGVGLYAGRLKDGQLLGKR